MIVGLERACDLARPWYESLDRSMRPPASINGSAAEFEAAIEAAAQILNSSRNPLIYGLSRSSTEGQRAAVQLADRLGATIDTTASRCHGPSILALQHVGESTCSLGEIRNRCDLIVFWGSNPQLSHPRHFERYSVEPAGQFVPGGRQDRTVVVVDVEPTVTSGQADHFLQVEPGRDFEAIWTLRALVQGIPIDEDRPCGAPLEQLRELAERMKTCRSGVVFFGLGLTRRENGHASVEALLRLVTDLNSHTRFYARRMRVPGDVTGADSVLCWQTGFPFAVNLARGYPRYGPGEYSANELLERRETDACLIVGSESIARLSPQALANLNELPTIVLDYPHVESSLRADVSFDTAIYGVHVPGTAYRMDETPIPLRSFLETTLPTDGQVLSRLEAAIFAGD